MVPQTLWTYDEVGHTQDAKKEIHEILEFKDSASVFSTPKPLRLLDRILRIATGPDDLVLDFFAGSGTTGHAVLKLNAEDGGRRRFILVSNSEATAAEPEKNLCRDVCARRLRRAIEGYKDHAPLAGDFAYLRCRRIAPGRLLELGHEQVWTALQMIHGDAVQPWQEGAYLVSRREDSVVVYVPRFAKSLVPALRQELADGVAAVVYSWQPEVLRQHVRAAHVQHEGVPESLARRFGLKS
jgi:adenine-specific DNA-methyltransferase